MKPMIVVVLGLMALSTLATASADEKCDDPLPEVVVTPPGPDVPQELAQFSGVWKGKWDVGLCSSLAIKTVDKIGKVQYVYSWGRGRNFSEGFRPGDAQITDGKLKFGQRAKFTFSVTEEGYLEGERVSGSWRNFVLMRKAANY